MKSFYILSAARLAVKLSTHFPGPIYFLVWGVPDWFSGHLLLTLRQPSMAMENPPWNVRWFFDKKTSVYERVFQPAMFDHRRVYLISHSILERWTTRTFFKVTPEVNSVTSQRLTAKRPTWAGTASREHDVGNGKINADIRGRSTTEGSRFSKTKASRNINVELMGGSAYADCSYGHLSAISTKKTP